MEIERKFLVAQLPDNLDNYNCRYIEQGYLSTKPVVRVRRDNDDYYLTYKGSGPRAGNVDIAAEHRAKRRLKLPLNGQLPGLTREAVEGRTVIGERD